MQWLTKLEHIVLKWVKNVPHLPETARKWLGVNVWWIALVGAILSAIAALFAGLAFIGSLVVMGTVGASYYVASTFTAWSIVTTLVNFVFITFETVLLVMAIKPLQDRQKKGWVLLFANWLLSLVAVVVNSILSLNPFGFITGIIFGAVFAAISGYFLFEIHSQFAHVEKSRGVKEAK